MDNFEGNLAKDASGSLQNPIDLMAQIMALSAKVDALVAANEATIQKHSKGVGFVTPEEEELAKAQIRESLGWEPPKAHGYQLLVKIHEREDTFKNAEGRDTGIAMPDMIAANEKYQNVTALVIGMGPIAYKDPRFYESGPLCRIGDWIIIPYSNGTPFSYRGVPMRFIPDDCSLGSVDDPDYVTRYGS